LGEGNRAEEQPKNRKLRFCLLSGKEYRAEEQGEIIYRLDEPILKFYK